MALSIPALALALTAFALPEPARGANEKHALGMADDAVGSDPVPMAAAFERLRKIKTFSALMSALAVLGLALTGAGAIFNLLLERTYGLDGVGRGVVASVTSVGGFIGLAIGARVSDRLFRDDPARVMRFVALGFATLGISYTAGIRMPEVWMLVVCHFVAAGATTAALASSSALVPSIVPYRMRGISFAVVGLYLVFVGGLVGGVLTGMLSDAVGGRTALTVLMPVGTLGAAAYLWSGSRHVRHDIALVAEELREEEAELARVAAGEGREDLLQVRNLDVSYGAVQVLFDVALTAHKGETLALLGTNGAGKSTLLRAISGLTLPHRGVVRFEGRSVTYTDATERVRRGIVQVAGGKSVFASLSVRENLLAGAHTFIWDAARLEERASEVLDLFPALVPLLDQPAGTLSGGEQQMLALAKALLLEPQILLIDELSLGLAPVAVQEILVTIDRLKAQGLTMVIVEQSINVALAVADRAVFMEKGRIRFEGRTADLLERDDLARAVFLGDEGG
jgi:ABC-type branched-subunit amino acid transport system ATPase component